MMIITLGGGLSAFEKNWSGVIGPIIGIIDLTVIAILIRVLLNNLNQNLYTINNSDFEL